MNSILITGGTGSLGSALVRELLRREVSRIAIYSRDELKQHNLRIALGDPPNCRWFIGDIRDRERLKVALNGIEYVIHAAALKQVPACEYNPDEAVATNVAGSTNVVHAAIEAGVKRAILVSTDKACASSTLYGATKLLAERIFCQGNAYAGARVTRFSAVRYGNVLGSRGSVVDVFRDQAAQKGIVSLTDPAATRFWITLQQAVGFVLNSLEKMQGGEVAIPRLPAGSVADLAEAVVPGVPAETIGLRVGEKRHELLISQDEADSAVELWDESNGGLGRFLLFSPYAKEGWGRGFRMMQSGFWYGSSPDCPWSQRRLTVSDLHKLLSC